MHDSMATSFVRAHGSTQPFPDSRRLRLAGPGPRRFHLQCHRKRPTTWRAFSTSRERGDVSLNIVTFPKISVQEFSAAKIEFSSTTTVSIRNESPLHSFPTSNKTVIFKGRARLLS